MERGTGRTTRHLIELAEMASEGKHVIMVHANWREVDYASKILERVYPCTRNPKIRYCFNFFNEGRMEHLAIDAEPWGRRPDYIAFDHNVYNLEHPVEEQMLRRWVEYSENIYRRIA
jgi:hypothetical protein